MLKVPGVAHSTQSPQGPFFVFSGQNLLDLVYPGQESIRNGHNLDFPFKIILGWPRAPKASRIHFCILEQKPIGFGIPRARIH